MYATWTEQQISISFTSHFWVDGRSIAWKKLTSIQIVSLFNIWSKHMSKQGWSIFTLCKKKNQSFCFLYNFNSCLSSAFLLFPKFVCHFFVLSTTLSLLSWYHSNEVIYQFILRKFFSRLIISCHIWLVILFELPPKPYLTVSLWFRQHWLHHLHPFSPGHSSWSRVGCKIQAESIWRNSSL